MSLSTSPGPQGYQGLQLTLGMLALRTFLMPGPIPPPSDWHPELLYHQQLPGTGHPGAK